MEKRKFTINMPNAGKAEFNRLSESLKRHLRRALPEEPPIFSIAGQPKATLQLAVKPKHAKAALMQISVWHAKKPDVELLVDNKLHRTARATTLARPLKTEGPEQVHGQLPDSDFVEEEQPGGPPKQLPDPEFVEESALDVPRRLKDHEFVDEETED